MIAKLRHPAVFTTASLVLSLAAGLGAGWQGLSGTLTQNAVARPAPAGPSEMQQAGWDFWTIEIENLASELKEERARLKKQAELLDQRSARLGAEEQEFAKLRAEIETLRKQITDRVIEISADEAKIIRSLAATYATLTPRAAVAILREMDDGTAVKILSLMKADAAGPIFEEMSRGETGDTPLARRAAQLSEKLRLMKSTKPGNSS